MLFVPVARRFRRGAKGFGSRRRKQGTAQMTDSRPALSGDGVLPEDRDGTVVARNEVATDPEAPGVARGRAPDADNGERDHEAGMGRRGDAS